MKRKNTAAGIPLCITESELMSISCWGGVWLVAVLVSTLNKHKIL